MLFATNNVSNNTNSISNNNTNNGSNINTYFIDSSMDIDALNGTLNDSNIIAWDNVDITMDNMKIRGTNNAKNNANNGPNDALNNSNGSLIVAASLDNIKSRNKCNINGVYMWLLIIGVTILRVSQDWIYGVVDVIRLDVIRLDVLGGCMLGLMCW